MTLIDGIDAAYPPDYATLPASIKVVAGYLGQVDCTPHIWTDAEIDAAKAHGYQWWPIVVPPQRGLNPQDGTVAAHAILERLAEINHPKTEPVLIDIEHNSYVANPSGAMAAVQAFRQTMAAAGWQKAIPYLPFVANQGWVAHWTNERPATLPQGWIGDQYGGKPGYDLDVFDASLFSNTPLPTGTGTPTESEPDVQTIDPVTIGGHPSTVGDAIGVIAQASAVNTDLLKEIIVNQETLINAVRALPQAAPVAPAANPAG